MRITIAMLLASTAAYADNVRAQGNPFAPRPLHSAMSLEKIRATGFEPEDAMVALDRYLSRTA